LHATLVLEAKIMEAVVKPSRRGLRQEIVVEALRKMRGSERDYSNESGLEEQDLVSQTTALLVQAENVVLFAPTPGYSAPIDPQPTIDDQPRYIQTSTFMRLMGIGQADAADLESLVKARLDASSGGTDGK
jgi:hypothetical protein